MITLSNTTSKLTQYLSDNGSKYGISRMGIFGSLARGEQTESSDIDICFEGKTPNLFTLAHIKYELESLLEAKVDLVRLRNNMDAILKAEIEKEVIYV